MIANPVSFVVELNSALSRNSLRQLACHPGLTLVCHLALQSDIDVKGFRSLAEGAEVEYTPQRTADGRLKATEVTGPDGTAVKVCTPAVACSAPVCDHDHDAFAATLGSIDPYTEG